MLAGLLGACSAERVPDTQASTAEVSTPPQTASTAAAFDPARWSERVGALVAAEMAGRRSGEPGYQRAVSWLANEFRAVGLAPVGEGYASSFRVALKTKARSAKIGLGGRVVTLGEGLEVLSFSGDALANAPVYFVGFGDADPQTGRDDYANLDVDGGVVLIFRRAPEGVSSKGENGPRIQALRAEHRGAAAVVFVDPPPDLHQTPVVERAVDLASPMRIPALRLSWRDAAGLLGEAEVERLWDAARSATGYRGGIFRGEKARVKARVERIPGTVANVIGRLPATASPTEPPIVIGAHLDHLGRLGDHAGEGRYHPGADDNASGVALMLALAESLGRVPGRTRDIYFVGFAGEEVGLVGSRHFVAHLPEGVDRVGLMVNFDMVGRLRGRKLTVFGVGSGAGLRERLVDAGRAHGLDLELEDSAYGPADALSFYQANVPVLSFFTGMHADYHTPRDTPEKLNAAGAMDVGRLVFDVLIGFATGEPLPGFRPETEAVFDHD